MTVERLRKAVNTETIFLSYTDVIAASLLLINTTLSICFSLGKLAIATAYDCTICRRNCTWLLLISPCYTGLAALVMIIFAGRNLLLGRIGYRLVEFWHWNEFNGLAQTLATLFALAQIWPNHILNTPSFARTYFG